MSMKRSAKYECPLVCSQNFKNLPIVCLYKFLTARSINKIILQLFDLCTGGSLWQKNFML